MVNRESLLSENVLTNLCQVLIEGSQTNIKSSGSTLKMKMTGSNLAFQPLPLRHLQSFSFKTYLTSTNLKEDSSSTSTDHLKEHYLLHLICKH